ncbi:MAG: sulfatase family protein, partial [Sphaerochaetaceae bacterium]
MKLLFETLGKITSVIYSDGMGNPVTGAIEEDHLDEQIPWMNSIIYADEINNAWARNLKTRYYGEISYIDSCIGRILDEVEQRADSENTMICFFADHGDMLGDHHGWQKETFYEASVKIPFIVSYPPRFEKNTVSSDLVSLTDLFGLATHLAGKTETRDGIDIITQKRDYLFSLYGRPNTRQFKIMVRHDTYKYIFMANGGREQLFNLAEDPNEMTNLINKELDMAQKLRQKAVEKCISEPDIACMTEKGSMKAYTFEPRPLGRLHQFAFSRGITNFIVPSEKEYI